MHIKLREQLKTGQCTSSRDFLEVQDLNFASDSGFGSLYSTVSDSSFGFLGYKTEDSLPTGLFI